MKLGRVDESIADRIRAEISELRDDGADVVVCTCSSIGAIAEEMNKTETIEVQRIDRAMADKAVGIGERIVLDFFVEYAGADSRAVGVVSSPIRQIHFDKGNCYLICLGSVRRGRYDWLPR